MRGDLVRALDKKPEISVIDAGSRDFITAYPDEALPDAVNRLLRSNIGRLPVALGDCPARLVGYLGRPGIFNARLSTVRDEHLRESGLPTQSIGEQ